MYTKYNVLQCHYFSKFSFEITSLGFDPTRAT